MEKTTYECDCCGLELSFTDGSHSVESYECPACKVMDCSMGKFVLLETKITFTDTKEQAYKERLLARMRHMRAQEAKAIERADYAHALKCSSCIDGLLWALECLEKG